MAPVSDRPTSETLRVRARELRIGDRLVGHSFGPSPSPIVLEAVQDAGSTTKVVVILGDGRLRASVEDGQIALRPDNFHSVSREFDVNEEFDIVRSDPFSTAEVVVPRSLFDEMRAAHEAARRRRVMRIAGKWKSRQDPAR
jgi:hypothetical protein